MGTRYSGYVPRAGRAAVGGKSAGPEALDGTRRSVADTVNVEIRGKRLAIRTDREPNYVHHIANYYDMKLRDLQAQAPTATFDKLLMLAGLMLVEELFDAQTELAHLRHDVGERTEALLAMLDREAKQVEE